MGCQLLVSIEEQHNFRPGDSEAPMIPAGPEVMLIQGLVPGPQSISVPLFMEFSHVSP